MRAIVMIAAAIVAATRADQDVAVLDVRELVRDDALELALIEEADDAFGRRDGRVLGLRPVANAFGDASGMT